MIILRSTHEALLKEKDSQLAALKDEIQWLRNFVQPSHARNVVINYEADAILEGRHEQLSEERPVSEEVAIERDKLLSGTY